MGGLIQDETRKDDDGDDSSNFNHQMADQQENPDMNEKLQLHSQVQSSQTPRKLKYKDKLQLADKNKAYLRKTQNC